MLNLQRRYDALRTQAQAIKQANDDTIFHSEIQDKAVSKQWLVEPSGTEPRTDWAGLIWPGTAYNELQSFVVEYLLSEGWSMEHLGERIRRTVPTDGEVPTDDGEFAELASRVIREVIAQTENPVPSHRPERPVPRPTTHKRSLATWRERGAAQGQRYAVGDRHRAPRGDASARSQQAPERSRTERDAISNYVITAHQ